MQERQLGRLGPLVSAIGLSCMGMSHLYGGQDDAESIATIHRAIDQGIRLIDTADVYGAGSNERLVGQAIAGHRHQIILATKFSFVSGEGGKEQAVNGRPEYARAA
jgi:aryl-alcohol dehydrogenase-like predicted oxidoreductase